jgi:tetratricopeptide (TPR) repeat protein
MNRMSPEPPSTVDAVVEEAVRQHKSGRLTPAEELYRRALSLQPEHPEANHNLGVILMQGGQVADSVPHFRIALEADGTRDLYWLSYARAQLIAGQSAEAGATLTRARAGGLHGPAVDALWAQVEAASGFAEQSVSPSGGDPQACLRRGDALAESGRLDEAVEAYEQALAIDPDLAEAHYHLGSVLSETDRIASGFAHLMRRAELFRGADDATAGVADAPPHKMKHDREQQAYLVERGLVDPGAPRPIFHLGDCGRLDGPAVNPAGATPELAEHWRSSWPRLVVIEDFLTPPALEKLRAYCADSTVWRRVYEAGYIGAIPPDGFACPLLAQIAEEIRSVYDSILAGHSFQYLAAFKYDSELSTGTNTHADVSAVNVNLYIAPDEANLDDRTGGMVVWDIEASSESEMRRLNSNEAELQAHLKRLGAKATHIPHRANRAIIFKSSLFHRTDECRFREGYLNKRINVSLLYGRWGAEP